MFHSTKKETRVQLNLADLVHEQDFFLKILFLLICKILILFSCDFLLVLKAQIYCLACKFTSLYTLCENIACFDIDIEVQRTR